MIKIHLIPRERVPKVWRHLLPGLDIYREKSPHRVGDDAEVLWNLTDSEGDRLVIVSIDGQYAGFLTFRVAEVEGETWGTFGMIFLTPQAQQDGVLEKIGPQLEAMLRSFGCSVMNYMTARKGFKRLAPKLGFKPRIIEWMKTL